MKDWFSQLNGAPAKWLVPGGAGFIGSHLVTTLLGAGQKVTVIDNFLTGHRSNLAGLSEKYGDNFALIEADINNADSVRESLDGVSYVLHQAALGSVPRSIEGR